MIHKPWLNPGGRIVEALSTHNSRNFPMKKLAAAVLISLLATACASQPGSGPYAHSSAAGGTTRSDATIDAEQPAPTLNDTFHYPSSD
jgi:hypothetical protein